MDQAIKKQVQKFIDANPKSYLIVASDYVDGKMENGVFGLEKMNAEDAIAALAVAVLKSAEESKDPFITMLRFIDKMVTISHDRFFPEKKYARNNSVRKGSGREAVPARKGNARKAVEAVPGKRSADRDQKAKKPANRSTK